MVSALTGMRFRPTFIGYAHELSRESIHFHQAIVTVHHVPTRVCVVGCDGIDDDDDDYRDK